MNGKTEKIFVLFLALLLTLFLCSSALAGSYPKISRQPASQTVEPGGILKFETKASNMTGITWRLVSPADGSWLLVRDVNTVFPGVQVSGKNSETLTLSNIPAEMNGWQVFCRFSNSTGSMDTEKATITVIGASVSTPTPPPAQKTDVTAAPAGTAGADLLPDGDGVTAVGATVEDMDMRPVSGNRMVLTDGGACCRIVAPRPADYWILNGARVVFDESVQVLILENVAEALTAEAVCGTQSRTESAGNALSARLEANGDDGFLWNGMRLTTIPAGVGCTVTYSGAALSLGTAENAPDAEPVPTRTPAPTAEPTPVPTPAPEETGYRSLQPDWDMIEEYINGK